MCQLILVSGLAVGRTDASPPDLILGQKIYEAAHEVRISCSPPHFFARQASVNSSSPDMIEYIVVNKPGVSAPAPGEKRIHVTPVRCHRVLRSWV